jgi:mRNA-degrading endonuclease RelE of RelBE toxin-antitoxin system
MSYKLAFLEAALKEWKKLAPNIREQFKKKGAGIDVMFDCTV